MEMNNTEKLKFLKKIIKKEPLELDMVRYVIAHLIDNKPTYKQLDSLRLDVVYKNRELKLLYFELITDMMLDIAQNREGETLEEYKTLYRLY